MRSIVLRLLSVLAPLVLGVPPHASAPVSYIPFKLHELAAFADVIVAGEIVELRDDDFDLAVEERILGAPVQDRLRVKRFQDWTCAGRWTHYTEGQRVLLFLHRPNRGGDLYSILGAGDEGEMPLLGGAVVVRYFRVHGYESMQPLPGNTRCSGPLVPLAELAEALRLFRDAFSWEDDGRFPIQWFDFRNEADALRLRDSSRMGRHLWESVESSAQWRYPRQEAPLPPDVRCLGALANGFAGQARVAPNRAAGDFEWSTGFGESCAYLGDVDGNGVEDLALGAPSDAYLRRGAGALWILLMQEEGQLLRAVEISEATSRIPGIGAFRGFGQTVQALGDLDGDGITEVVVGSGAGESTGNRHGMWILHLDRSGGAARSEELGEQKLLQAAGVGDVYALGGPLANLGDLDSDGFPELAVSLDPKRAGPLGFVEEWEEGPSILVLSLDGDGEVLWTRVFNERESGIATGYLFGTSLAGIGDVDGDKVPDVAIGKPEDCDGGSSRGAVWIANLCLDGSISHRQKISDWEGCFDGILRDEEGFGRTVASPGDLDRDGVPDLVVGGDAGIWALFLNRDGTVKRYAAWTATLPELGHQTMSALACGSLQPGEAGGVCLAVGGRVDRLPSIIQDGVVRLLRLGGEGSLASQ